MLANLKAAGFDPRLPPPKVWCHIRSYHGDARWLMYALRSLHRYARHVLQRVVVAVPMAEIDFFNSFLAGQAPWVEVVALTRTVTGGDDSSRYEQVNYDVLTADERVRDDVDFIFHMDSDSVLVRHLTWTDLFEERRAIGRITRYDRLPPHVKQSTYANVKEAVGRINGETSDDVDIIHDFAYHHVGALYPRRAYLLTRQRVEAAHGKSFRAFVSGSTVTVPDYNLIGAVMYLFHRNDMRWTEIEPSSPSPSEVLMDGGWGGENNSSTSRENTKNAAETTVRFPVLRFSSWSGVTMEEAARLECVLQADVRWEKAGKAEGKTTPPRGGGGRWTPDPFETCPAFDLCALQEYRGKHRRRCNEGEERK